MLIVLVRHGPQTSYVFFIAVLRPETSLHLYPSPALDPACPSAQINYLLSCSAMLVQAKRTELIYKAKQRSRTDGKKTE